MRLMYILGVYPDGNPKVYIESFLCSAWRAESDRPDSFYMTGVALTEKPKMARWEKSWEFLLSCF